MSEKYIKCPHCHMSAYPDVVRRRACCSSLAYRTPEPRAGTRKHVAPALNEVEQSIAMLEATGPGRAVLMTESVHKLIIDQLERARTHLQSEIHHAIVGG